MASETTLVQMRLQPKTMNRINRISEMTGTANKTQLISTSLEVLEEFLKSERKGAKIFIENPDGTKQQLKIVGL
jgi:hypothetical protein